MAVNKDAMIRLRGDAREARDAFREVQGELNQTRTGLIDIGRQAGQMGRRMMAASGVAIAGLSAAGKQAMNFGLGMAEVSTLVDTAEVNIHEMEESLKELSVESGRSLDDLTKGLYDTVSAGIQAGDAIEFMGVASKTAVAGVSDVATSVDILTTLTNSYGYTASDAESISDMLFATIRAGKTTLPELAHGMSYVASTAAQANVPLEETLAALATMTALGVPTTQAARSINQALLGFIRPSTQAAERASSLGIELSAATLASEGLLGSMSLLREATGGSVEDLAEIAGSSEALRAVLNLTGKGFETFEQNVNDTRDSTGEMTDAFNKMAESTAERMNRLKQALAVLSVDIGEAVIPIGEMLAEDLLPQLQALSKWMRENPALVRRFAEAMAVLFVTGALGNALHGVTHLVVAVKSLGPALALLNPASAAVVAVVGGLILIGKEAYNTRKEIEDLAEAQDIMHRSALARSLEWTRDLLRDLLKEQDAITSPDMRQRVSDLADRFEAVAQKGATIKDIETQGLIQDLDSLRRNLDQAGESSRSVDRVSDALSVLQARADIAATAADQVRRAWKNVFDSIKLVNLETARGVKAGSPPWVRTYRDAPGQEQGQAGLLPLGLDPQEAGIQALEYLSLGGREATASFERLRVGQELLQRQKELLYEREQEVKSLQNTLRTLDRNSQTYENVTKELEHMAAQTEAARDAVRLTEQGLRRLESRTDVFTEFMRDGEAPLEAVVQLWKSLSSVDLEAVAPILDEFIQQEAPAVVEAFRLMHGPGFEQAWKNFLEGLEESAMAGASVAEIMQLFVAELYPSIHALRGARAVITRSVEALDSTPLPPEVTPYEPGGRMTTPRSTLDIDFFGRELQQNRERIAEIRRVRQALADPEFQQSVQDFIGFFVPEEEALSQWEEFQQGIVRSWDDTTTQIADRFISSFADALMTGENTFRSFTDAVAKMTLEISLRNLIGGQGGGMEWGAVGGALLGGGPLGVLTGGLLGSFIGDVGGFFGNLFSFDDPVNDAMARRSGRDFTRHFVEGVQESAERSSSRGVTIQILGDQHYYYPSEAETEAGRLARHTEVRTR